MIIWSVKSGVIVIYLGGSEKPTVKLTNTKSEPKQKRRKTKLEKRSNKPEVKLSKKTKLEEIFHHLKNTGQDAKTGLVVKMSLRKGNRILFTGGSGIEKTKTANKIAKKLGLALYKVDLSKIITKYIGETEKNIDKIFEEAASSNTVLFFDEADALFGKRTKIKDSHDRYANIEVNYLLQKIEKHRGIVILTTNFIK